MTHDLCNCRECGALMIASANNVCLRCAVIEDQLYSRIRKHLREHPGQTAPEVSEELGINIARVTKLIRQGRVQLAMAQAR